MAIIKENMGRELDSMNEKYLLVRTKVDEQEYKVNNVLRSLESIKNNLAVAGTGGGMNTSILGGGL